jgi:hypothetical protein
MLVRSPMKARLTSEVVNSYGDGLYLAFSKDLAKEYAIDYDRPSILSAKIKAKKPKKFPDSIAFGDFLIENNIPSDDSQSKNVTVKMSQYCCCLKVMMPLRLAKIEFLLLSLIVSKSPFMELRNYDR